jgi:hypothetical protein
MLRSIKRPAYPSLGPCYNLADRPTTQTTSPKGHCFKESIIDLLPFTGFEQFYDSSYTHRRVRALKIEINIGTSLARDITTPHSLIKKGFPFAHFASNARTAARNVQPSPS